MIVNLDTWPEWNILNYEYSEAKKRITKLEDLLFSMGAMDKPPCFCCGYNGPGYFQPEHHKCAERHYRLRNLESIKMN